MKPQKSGMPGGQFIYTETCGIHNRKDAFAENRTWGLQHVQWLYCL